MEERPGIYVRLEVEVTWPRHYNKRRSISYTSGATKNRQQEALLATTGVSDARAWAQPHNHCPNDSDQAYLRHVYNYASQYNYIQEQSPWQARYDYSTPAGESCVRPALPSFEQPTAHSNYQAFHSSNRQQIPQNSSIDILPRRSRGMSSCDSQGSPAPFHAQERPWDAEPEPLGSTALPVQGRSSEPRSQTWKPLPSMPNKFRLGEDAMPWLGSPGPAEYSAVEFSRRGCAEASSSSPAAQCIASTQLNVDDRGRGRTVEMQSLATALMTVDNGFEDQWWFQGPRAVTVAGDLIPPAPLRDMFDHIASEPRVYAPLPSARPLQSSTPTSTIIDLVSPLSGFSSPASHGSRLET